MTACSVVLVLTAILVLLGAAMTWRDWRRRKKLAGGGGLLEGLAKVLRELKGIPIGQRMIVFGIIVLIVGGAYCAGSCPAPTAEKSSTPAKPS